jgi:hypothetical protein
MTRQVVEAKLVELAADRLEELALVVLKPKADRL